MFEKIEGGNVVNIQGLDCCLPPVGYIFNIITKKIEYRGVHERSPIKEEQYWERIPLPDWYGMVMKKWDEYEKKKKEDDPEFYDERLEEYKRQEWDRRLNGMWYRNNGEPVYLVGSHYLYMQWWSIDIGYPKFRMPDLEYFYFLQYCIEDPDCMGALEITKRRFGKTFRGGLFVTEYVTRTKMTNGTIQSKTGSDAKKVFSKAIVNPFRRLPRFFRPEYDMSLGVNPKTEMRFQKTNVRGKKADENIDKDELGSVIDHHSADPLAQDGMKVHRGFQDEWAKCFGKGTKIRMYDGTIKNVEDVLDGELVMGDDSTPRVASGITNGIEEMYEIIPNKGDGFICNESHILTLSVSDKFNYNGIKYKAGDIIELTVGEYLNYFPSRYYKCIALYRTGWDLPERLHLIDPYMFGVWLGDGNSSDFSITSIDTEILSAVNSFADEHSLFVRKKEDGISYHVTSKKVGVNHVTKELRRLSVLKNKHIPSEYLIDSRENRLQLLAGLIDTDGYSIVRNGYSSGMEIVQKRKKLAYNINELALSLGFFSSVHERIATMRRADKSIYRCTVYKVLIYGDVDLIPNRVERKKAIISRTKNRRNPLKTGFTIKSIGEGEYFGFTVDRNNLFLLADGTVVHNTTECDIYARHEVMRYCVVDDEGNIIGKLLYSSTVEKLDSEKEGVQDGAKKLWQDSNHLNKGENGRTSSGLYRFFMTAKRAKNFDLYGYPNEEKTLKEILADRETVKNNPRSLSARIRKEPLSTDEAFMEDGDKCIFNITNIFEREKQLEDNPIYKRKIKFYRDGETQLVKWRDANKSEEDFCWHVTYIPTEDKANKFYMEGGRKSPGMTRDGAIAVDSYSNSQGGRKYGSKASAWMGRRYDVVDAQNTNKAFGHLYGRPKIKDELHEQVLLAGEYLGYKIWYEFTADDYEGYYRERGKYNYLGNFPLNTIEPSKRATTERLKGVPLTPFSLTTQHDMGISYFEKYCHLIDFEEILTNAKKFDPYNRTEFDALVAFLILIVVLNEPVVEPVKMTTPLIKLYPNNSYVAKTI